MVKEIFVSLLTPYTADEALKNSLWVEIEQAYSGKERHYHNLSHLQNVYDQLLPVKKAVKSWETILFTLFYHDVVYNALATDNEQQSAHFAEERLERIGVPKTRILDCKTQILATRQHLENADPDTNYFTDADLSILGQAAHIYEAYRRNVRKEYAVYPDSVYNPGRKKVLKHFLQMKQIFKTPYFQTHFESNAKENLTAEFNSL